MQPAADDVHTKSVSTHQCQGAQLKAGLSANSAGHAVDKNGQESCNCSMYSLAGRSTAALASTCVPLYAPATSYLPCDTYWQFEMDGQWLITRRKAQQLLHLCPCRSLCLESSSACAKLPL